VDAEVPHVREVLEFALAVALVIVLSVVVAGRLVRPASTVQSPQVPSTSERVVVGTGALT
jgi:hypothetical protein